MAEDIKGIRVPVELQADCARLEPSQSEDFKRGVLCCYYIVVKQYEYPDLEKRWREKYYDKCVELEDREKRNNKLRDFLKELQREYSPDKTIDRILEETK